MHDDFADIGDSEPFEANYKSLTILAPVILNSDNKLKIVNGDPDYPLIYLESFKKFLLTYQPKEDEEGKLTNETKGIVYSHKYSHIGAESKIPDLQAGPDYNDSGRPKPREEDL